MKTFLTLWLVMGIIAFGVMMFWSFGEVEWTVSAVAGVLGMAFGWMFPAALVVLLVMSLVKIMTKKANMD